MGISAVGETKAGRGIGREGGREKVTSYDLNTLVSDYC